MTDYECRCGAAYGDPVAADLCCDQRAQAALLARRWAAAETGRRDDRAPGVTRTGPGATDVYPPGER